MEVLLCERVNGLRHSHFHLLNCLITTASELREKQKSLGSKVWTIGMLSNCFDTHLDQISCDKDEVVDWCIVQVEMPLTRFEEFWPLPTESFSELPENFNKVTLILTLWPINSGVFTSLLRPYLSSSLADSLLSLNLLCHSKTDARLMPDGRKAVWSIPYVSVAFFSSLKHNFIAYRSSKVSDCIFEIHQLWQSGFRRVYSNCCCSYSLEPEIIKIGQSSHNMYSNKVLNFQESTTILNACTKMSGNLSYAPGIFRFWIIMNLSKASVFKSFF